MEYANADDDDDGNNNKKDGKGKKGKGNKGKGSSSDGEADDEATGASDEAAAPPQNADEDGVSGPKSKLGGWCCNTQQRPYTPDFSSPAFLYYVAAEAPQYIGVTLA